MNHFLVLWYVFFLCNKCKTFRVHRFKIFDIEKKIYPLKKALKILYSLESPCIFMNFFFFSELAQTLYSMLNSTFFTRFFCISLFFILSTCMSWLQYHTCKFLLFFRLVFFFFFFFKVPVSVLYYLHIFVCLCHILRTYFQYLCVKGCQWIFKNSAAFLL